MHQSFVTTTPSGDGDSRNMAKLKYRLFAFYKTGHFLDFLTYNWW